MDIESETEEQRDARIAALFTMISEIKTMLAAQETTQSVIASEIVRLSKMLAELYDLLRAAVTLTEEQKAVEAAQEKYIVIQGKG